MLKLKQIADIVTVPDKFTFRFAQDGVLISANSKTDWFEKIKKHADDNGYVLEENWREIAENQLCRRLSGEWCIGGGEHSFINTRFTLEDFARGAKIAITGKIVDQHTAEERAIICSRCVANVSIPGCSACSGLANLVASLKGAKQTKHDHLLKACAVCLCANEAQVWYEAEDLAKGVTPEMMKTFAEIDEDSGCWKYIAVRELIDSQAQG